MKKHIVGLMIAFWINSPVFAEENIFSRPFIKSIIDKVNQYQFTHPWTEKDDNWIRGTYYTGVMAVYQSTGDEKFLKQCDNWGRELKWQIPKLAPEQKSSGVNLLTCGQTWLESYMVKKNKEKIKSIIAHLEDPEIRNPVSNPLEWYFEAGTRYVDGLFTGPPALAMLYKITGKEKYLDWMDGCFWDVYGKLYNIEEGLFYRDERFITGYSGKISPGLLRADSILHKESRKTYVYQKTINGEKVIWSRGNGWALAGLARILKYLPANHANYQRYKAVFEKMATELKKRQQPDGFWYPNLADPKDYGMAESSGTGFFIYGLTWGINNGILPKDEFLPVVTHGWKALVSVVSDEGKVQWGQLVGASPYKILKEDSHEYVTGTFLLAASEIYKLNP